MAVVGATHASPRLMLPSVLAPGLSEALGGRLPASLAALGAAEDEAQAAELVAAHEASLAAAVRAAVSAWDAEVDAAVKGSATSSAATAEATPAAATLSITRLKELVASGAASHAVSLQSLKYVAPTGPTARLNSLSETLKMATSWQEKVAEQLAKPQSTDGLKGLLEEGERIPLRLSEVEEVRGRLQRVDAWLVGTRQAMQSACELRELQELQREAEALRIKMPEAEALRERTAACRKWMLTIHNELLRRASSRKAAGVRLSVAAVEGLLAEAATLQLEAIEITQVGDSFGCRQAPSDAAGRPLMLLGAFCSLLAPSAPLWLSARRSRSHAQVRDRLDDARKWSEEAAAVLTPPKAVTPQLLAHLDDLAHRAEELYLTLGEQEALDARLGYVRDWLARAKAAMDSNAAWQVLTKLVKEAKANAVELPEVRQVAELQVSKPAKPTEPSQPN